MCRLILVFDECTYQLVPFAGTCSILTPGQCFYIQEDKVDEKGDNSEGCELEAAMKADDEATRKAEEETAPKTETGSKYCFRLLCEHDQVRIFLHVMLGNCSVIQYKNRLIVDGT